MSSYSLIVFVHVLAAAAWVGAAIMNTLIFELSLRDNARAWLLKHMEYEDKLAGVFFIPASLLTLIAGLALVWRGGYDFANGWVGAGLGVWILLFVIGITTFAPAGKRIKAAVAEHGIESPEVMKQLTFLRTVARIDLLILV